MLTNLAHAYDFNHLINPSYSGPLIQVAKAVGGANSYTDFQDINAVDGLVDRSAIETFSDGLPVFLYKIYDQVGTAHRTYTNDATNVGVQIFDGTVFPEDEFGRIEAMSTGGGGRNWTTPSDQTNPSLDVTGAFSLYARVGPLDNTISAHRLAGLGDNSTYNLFGPLEGNTSTGFKSAGFGSPKHWIDNVDQADQTRGDMWTTLTQSGFKTVAITGGTFPDPTGDQFRFFRGRFENWVSLQGIFLIYDADTEADHTDILAFIDSFYDDVQIPRATITYPDGHPSAGNPIVGADVQWLTEDPFSATDPQWAAPAIVGSNYITNGQGVVEYDPSTDPAVDPDKVYTAIFRKWEWDGTKWEQVTGAATAINNVDLTPPA